jgi:hypothetical protein
MVDGREEFMLAGPSRTALCVKRYVSSSGLNIDGKVYLLVARFQQGGRLYSSVGWMKLGDWNDGKVGGRRR